MAGNLRSPRKRALEIGTDPSKFEDGAPYDAPAGAPPQEAGGRYKAMDGTSDPAPGPVDTPNPVE